jgi:hypothetical protein
MILLSPGIALSADGDAIIKQLDKNLNPPSFEFYRKVINVEPDGARKEFVLFSVKKGADKVAGVFLEPASEKGRTTLRVGENYWLYIPSVGKPIRITNVQSITGGVFNNADILGVDYSVEYGVEKMEDKGATYLMFLKARNRSVAYDKVRMVVDKKTILPIQIDAMTEKEMLIKTLYFKNVKNFGKGITRPSVIESESPLQKGYKSIMIFAKLEPRKLSDEVFTLNFMERLESLLK